MSRRPVAVVGGGLVGLATAMALIERGYEVLVLEAEADVATHQSGRNSNVIHSGLYYAPGSLRARLCTDGREAMYRFCAAHGVPHERCGKVVVATTDEEAARLDALAARGVANGLTGLRKLSPDELREREPHVAARAALFVPDTGIVDFRSAAQAMAAVIRSRGGEVRCAARVLACRRDGPGLVVETTAGTVTCDGLVACAGLQADRVARLCGLTPRVTTVPFRGEYYEIVPERRSLVRHLIYPTPDPRLPFLGVHFTRMVDGRIEAGPNAVLALAREGYRRTAVSARDVWEMARSPGVRRLLRRYWRIGAGEYHRSFSRRAFVGALQALIPEIAVDDLAPGGCGVRAMAVSMDGALVDDFEIVAHERMVHVLNAPSPAATASTAIGRLVAERVVQQLAA